MSNTSAAPAETAPVRGKFDPARIADLLVRNAMVVVMIVVIAYFSLSNERFLTPQNLLTIAVAAAPFALIALGQTLVILTGGIDLSVGSLIAVSAMSAAWVVKGHPERLALCVAAAILIGLLFGSINGFLVAQLGLPPFIATLGSMTTASGFAYVIGGGAPINGLPQDFGKIANTQIFGITVPVMVMVAAIVLLAFTMSRTSYGMRVYAVGGNRMAAQIAGVNTKRILFSVYAFSGLLAGLSGVMLASRVISGPPNLGKGFELDAIAAVVIGGASLMGGRGTVWGTVLGLLLIQTMNNGLDMLVVPAYWQAVIKGILIVAAVSVDVWATRRRT